MTEPTIPKSAKQFFLRSVDSIAQWEALLLLHSAPEQQFSIQQLSASLYISEAETRSLLGPLLDRGFIERSEEGEPRFRYRPKSEVLARQILECASFYRSYLIPVTRIIHSKPRTGLRAFADAFKLRED